MSDCIFCKIVEWLLPSNIIYEDNEYLCFNNIDPQAPIHLLIIPKVHIKDFHTLELWNLEVAKWLFDVANKVIKQLWLNWCQLHINSWFNNWQTVFHLHMHLLSGWKNVFNL